MLSFPKVLLILLISTVMAVAVGDSLVGEWTHPTYGNFEIDSNSITLSAHSYPLTWEVQDRSCVFDRGEGHFFRVTLVSKMACQITGPKGNLGVATRNNGF